MSTAHAGPVVEKCQIFLISHPCHPVPSLHGHGGRRAPWQLPGQVRPEGQELEGHDGRGRARGTFLPLIAVVWPRLPSPELLAPEMRERQAFQCHNSESITYISGRFRDCRQVRDSSCGEWS